MSYVDKRPTGWPTLVRGLVIGTGLTLMISQSQYLTDEAIVGYARWVFLGLLCVMLALRPPKRVRVRRPQIVDAVFAVFVTLAFASAIYSSDVSITLQRAASTVLLYTAVFWTLWFYTDLAGEEKLIDALILTAAVVFVACAFSFFLTESSMMRGRFRGIMENPNALGMLTIIFLPLIISRFIRKRKAIDLMLIALVVASVVVSGSRNGVFTASLAAIFLLWRTRAWKAALVLSVIGTVAVLSMPESTSLQDLESRPEVTRFVTGSKSSITSGRAEAWQVAIPIIQQRPSLGYGFGTEDRIFDGMSFRIHRGLYVHNSYLGLAYQLGLVGAVTFFGPLLLLLISRAFARRTESVQMASYEAILFGGLIASLFESWVYSVGNAFVFPFWICVMLMVRNGVRAPSLSATTERAVAHVVMRPRNPASGIRPLMPTGAGRAIERFDPPGAGYR